MCTDLLHEMGYCVTNNEVKLMLFCLVFLDDHTVYIEKHRSYNWIAFKFNLKRDNMVKDYFLKGDKHSLEVNRTMHFLSLRLPVDHSI